MDNNKVNITQLQGGINKDLEFIQTKSENPTFALNMIRDNSEGGSFSWQSEPGNELCFEKEGFEVVGTIYGQDNIVYLFITDGTVSEIGELNCCNYTTIVSSSCLNFSTKNPIKGEYRIRNGCERMLYWNDCHRNSDRYLNLDELDEFFTDGVLDCNKLKFNPDIQVPCIQLDAVNDTGGSLPLGMYYFQIEIFTDSGNTVYRSCFSPGVSIWDEQTGTSFQQIDGGFNVEQVLPELGGVPTTSKSITLNFSNLDTRFNTAKINVIRAVTGDGETLDAHTVERELNIVNDTLTFTYTGFNPTRDTNRDVDELLIPTVHYDSCAIEQVQQRLVRANLRENVRDYSNYQRFASKIITNYTVREFELDSQFSDGNGKNPNTLWDNMSFMGDEIYALSIVYLHNDGTESPAFHIPGVRVNRLADEDCSLVLNSIDDVTVTAPIIGLTWDDARLPTWNPDLEPFAPEVDENGVNYNDLPVGDKLFKWQVYNTAVKTSDTGGRMGYYECSTTYPDTLDCNGESIWGDDYCGDSLAGQPIRHHRFPCRTLEPVSTNVEPALTQTVGRSLGVEFSNIEYPNDDIVGHYFVRAKRDDFNKTVLDKGFMYHTSFPGIGNTSTTESFALQTLVGNFIHDEQVYSFFSPKVLTEREYLNGSYMKLERVLSSFLRVVGVTEYEQQDLTVTTVTNFWGIEPDSFPWVNRAYDGNIYVNTESTQAAVQGFTSTLNNVDVAHDVNLYHFNTPIPRQFSSITINPTFPLISLFQTVNKAIREVYCDLENLVYVKMNTCALTLEDSQVLYGGDTFINTSLITTSSGVTGIENNDPRINGRLHAGIVFESENNFGLIFGGSTECNARYEGGNLADYWRFRHTEENDEGERQPVTGCERERYFYNPDLDRLHCENLFIPLSDNYDYCSECLNEFPNRLVFSDVSLTVDRDDAYLYTKANDFIDIPAHRGPIQSIKYKNNQLLVHTDQTTFILQPNPQQILTDQNVAYLGSGEFLGVPPYEIQQTDVGYAGTKSRLGYTDSKFGYTWVDETNGNVLNYTSKVSELSSKGLSQWFKENLPLKLKEQFRCLGMDYNCELPNTNGIGVVSTYDPRYHRLIITKRDFRVLNESLFGGIYSVGDPLEVSKLYFFEDQNRWFQYRRGDQFAPVDITNSDFFENCSWTVSYSYNYQSWSGWHSYTPSIMFNDETHYYTVDGGKVYRHLHESNYATYYGIKRPHIIEWVDADYITKDLHAIHWIGNPRSFDSNRRKWIVREDKPFNRAVFYNDCETSGLLELKFINQTLDPYGTLDLTEAQKAVIVTDNNYKVSGIRDTSIAQPINSCAWQEKLPWINQYGYIDEVPINFNQLDLTNNNYYKDLNGKFLVSRLIYIPDEEDIKQTINLAMNNNFNSIR